MAGLVGNPFLVHVVVDARQDAHDLAAAGVDADRRAERVHHVDGLGLRQLPGPRRERIGLRGQRADRAEIDHVALQLRRHRLLEIGGDLHVLAAADGAELRHARDLRREADAPRAMDAAVHDRLDQRADILVLDRALVLVIAAGIDAVGHRLVLQVAFAALVADRAVERMVDQQEFHHAFAGLAHHRRRHPCTNAQITIAQMLGAGDIEPRKKGTVAPGPCQRELRRHLNGLALPAMPLRIAVFRRAVRSPAGSAAAAPHRPGRAVAERTDRVALSICFVTSNSMSISRFCARPSAIRSARATSSPCPPDTACTGRSSRGLVEIRDARHRPDCRCHVPLSPSSSSQ